MVVDACVWLFVHMHMWIGCVGVWVHGYVGIWVYGCGCVGVGVCVGRGVNEE